MSEIGDALRRELGTDRVLDDAAALDAHRLDYWILAHLRARQGRLGADPACVVPPAVDRRGGNRGSRRAAPRRRRRRRTAAAPGVLGGAVPPAGSRGHRPACDGPAARARRDLAAGPGRGGDDGRRLRARDHRTRLHHRPLPAVDRARHARRSRRHALRRVSSPPSTATSRICCSGSRWCCRAAETLRLSPVPRASTGPSLRELFLGSEGALGIVTEVTLRVFPLPERRALASFACPDVPAGLDLIRRVVRVGWRPPVLRLYDATETARTFQRVDARRRGAAAGGVRGTRDAGRRRAAGDRSGRGRRAAGSGPRPSSTGSRIATRCRRGTSSSTAS